jgi:hypothetical protein
MFIGVLSVMAIRFFEKRSRTTSKLLAVTEAPQAEENLMVLLLA